jgi:hypothetical protein
MLAGVDDEDSRYAAWEKNAGRSGGREVVELRPISLRKLAGASASSNDLVCSLQQTSLRFASNSACACELVCVESMTTGMVLVAYHVRVLQIRSNHLPSWF